MDINTILIIFSIYQQFVFVFYLGFHLSILLYEIITNYFKLFLYYITYIVPLNLLIINPFLIKDEPFNANHLYTNS